MNGFQEQQLFTGATQSQGFAPEQAVDTTIGLRENYQVANANTKRFVEAARLQNEQKLAKKVELYNTIGDLVPQAKKYGEQLAKAYLDSQAVNRLGFCRVPGFALGCCAGFKPFWPLAIAQQAPLAIIFQA